MVESAAHLVDHVFSEVPVRQFVLTFPIPLRFLLVAQPQAPEPGAGGRPARHLDVSDPPCRLAGFHWRPNRCSHLDPALSRPALIAKILAPVQRREYLTGNAPREPPADRQPLNLT
jgi:hypothetical protein